MLTFQGKSVINKTAIGKIFVYKREERQVIQSKVSDISAELARFHSAREEAIVELRHLYGESAKTVGESGAAIFEMYRIMLEDVSFIEAVENIIAAESINAEYGIAAVSDRFQDMFSGMEDAYMRERAADVKAVSKRMLRILSGDTGGMPELAEPVIIVAEDLTPGETVQLPKEKVLAFVTVQGSPNSHTAILARTMNIPALVRTPLPLDDAIDGKLGVIDGENGLLYVEPEEEILTAIEARREAEEEKRQQFLSLRGRESVTLDGRKINLFANIGNSEDLPMVLENDAEGIGLLRSEFLYLGKKDYPTEEEQFAVYKTVAETMVDKPVIIRTLDIGDDKQADYFKLPKEENPAMGLRGIRICLTRPEVFKTQLRAIFRAGTYGNIAIMYPMITSMEEIRRIKEIVSEVKAELKGEGIPYKELKQGIMIETPAAAIISNELAKEVDFFSIGTNDLTQYTLAIDRQNPELDAFYDAHHPAILKMIQTVVENAHKAGIRVGICGELGADTSLMQDFLQIGVDELSVSPSRILPLRKMIRESGVDKR
ncbi:MAG: phosphoenolpyruvate--protein phosphotransferase [Lachnospiraceae bacterium]|nr:phosphoenolpyruvate--protein phosphotransferase [Lachnospiraceae bacterium]